MYAFLGESVFHEQQQSATFSDSDACRVDDTNRHAHTHTHPHSRGGTMHVGQCRTPATHTHTRHAPMHTSLAVHNDSDSGATHAVTAYNSSSSHTSESL